MNTYRHYGAEELEEDKSFAHQFGEVDELVAHFEARTARVRPNPGQGHFLGGTITVSHGRGGGVAGRPNLTRAYVGIGCQLNPSQIDPQWAAVPARGTATPGQPRFPGATVPVSSPSATSYPSYPSYPSTTSYPSTASYPSTPAFNPATPAYNPPTSQQSIPSTTTAANNAAIFGQGSASQVGGGGTATEGTTAAGFTAESTMTGGGSAALD
ncbi:hypothetical protein QC762_707650 [Podospora pseudocomata]|uniref:Uncharacterized protein n=1 Tax=Podospora pseudocomata TaxID=2093779 RepID=A0ABR0G409_9PEZI|nr:hypothetical protein QC762_707650 [Podospora pseudocomata]